MRVIEVNMERLRNEGEGETGDPEKTRRPTASSGTIPTCENPVARPGIEPGSPWSNRVQSPAGSLPDFCKWESCRTMSLVSGFSRGSPVSPTLAIRRCSIITSFHPHRLSRHRQQLITAACATRHNNLPFRPARRMGQVKCLYTTFKSVLAALGLTKGYGTAADCCKRRRDVFEICPSFRTALVPGIATHWLRKVPHWLSCWLASRLPGADWLTAFQETLLSDDAVWMAFTTVRQKWQLNLGQAKYKASDGKAAPNSDARRPCKLRPGVAKYLPLMEKGERPRGHAHTPNGITIRAIVQISIAHWLHAVTVEGYDWACCTLSYVSHWPRVPQEMPNNTWTNEECDTNMLPSKWPAPHRFTIGWVATWQAGLSYHALIGEWRSNVLLDGDVILLACAARAYLFADLLHEALRTNVVPDWLLRATKCSLLAELPAGKYVDATHVYTEVDFAIGSQFIRHALDPHQPIADWGRNKWRIPYCQVRRFYWCCWCGQLATCQFRQSSTGGDMVDAAANCRVREVRARHCLAECCSPRKKQITATIHLPRPLIVASDGPLSFRDLCTRANAEAVYLPSAGVCKETVTGTLPLRRPPTSRDMSQERANAKGDIGKRIKCRIASMREALDNGAPVVGRLPRDASGRRRSFSSSLASLAVTSHQWKEVRFGPASSQIPHRQAAPGRQLGPDAEEVSHAHGPRVETAFLGTADLHVVSMCRDNHNKVPAKLAKIFYAILLE
ncbi:hypothetical protein PR048_010034 [Dryococelus australis]|uniref:Uncharacterized protein n=1 Tax=Dryococelus australis TaxID=614101 RepID=A0ABQ9I1J5_9NEOP|nr:hypothetical protein PR048_010034 [Dryococelus australis]